MEISVGNEKGLELKTVTLTEYLNNFSNYLTNGKHLEKGKCLLKKKD